MLNSKLFTSIVYYLCAHIVQDVSLVHSMIPLGNKPKIILNVRIYYFTVGWTVLMVGRLLYYEAQLHHGNDALQSGWLHQHASLRSPRTGSG
jgi:hypothetical protein